LEISSGNYDQNMEGIGFLPRRNYYSKLLMNISSGALTIL